MAIVNGESCKVGDIIDGAEIVEITESAVSIKFAGTTFSRELGQGCGGAKQIINTIGQTIEQANRQLQSSMGSSSDTGSLPDIFSKSSDLGLLDQETMAGGVVLMIVLAVLLLVTYVYFAITLQMVAKKTQTSNSWLAWVPIGNIVLMCMVARRPLWWVPLIIILPVTIIGIIPAFIMMVLIFMGIADARDKPKWLAALICVPFINGIGAFFYWGYLAFSSNTEKIDTDEIESIPQVNPQEIKETESSQKEISDSDSLEESPQEPKKGLDEDPPVYDG